MRLSPARARKLGIAAPAETRAPEAPRRSKRSVAHGAGRPPRQSRVEFVIDGRPVAKGRHKHARAGTQVYTPRATRAYAEHASQLARLAMGRTGPMRGPVRAHIVAELEPPVSWSAPRRAAALAQEIAPSVKPDLDNLLKNVYDAMNGIVYTDDSQIVSKIVDKRYGPRPRVIVRIEPTGQKPAYP